MPSDQWDPATYREFAALRARPFWDLVSLIDPSTAIERLVDLGCGSGELTAALAQRLGATDTLGVDSSPAMLEAASEHESDRVRFEHGDIAIWTGVAADVIVANASLQWVADHPAVLERWLGSLAPGGQLAVQVPANADHPSHTCMVDVAEREPFLSAMGGSPPPDPVVANVLSPTAYAETLHGLGIADPHVRLQVYPQVMESSASVVDWVSGTSLRRFLKVLPDELHRPFVDAYRSDLLMTIGDRRPYFYAFKRILMYGRSPAN